jgi:hypothetical protein
VSFILTLGQSGVATNTIVAILPIIYHKDKVQYFNNKFAMMVIKADRGKLVN